jgi:hypothetical protein
LPILPFCFLRITINTRNLPIMKTFAFAVLLGAVLLSGHLVSARESEWCAQQRQSCAAKCPADAKMDFKCQDSDGAAAAAAPLASAR